MEHQALEGTRRTTAPQGLTTGSGDQNFLPEPLRSTEPCDNTDGRKCGCRGIRWCAVCAEDRDAIKQRNHGDITIFHLQNSKSKRDYCYRCQCVCPDLQCHHCPCFPASTLSDEGSLRKAEINGRSSMELQDFSPDTGDTPASLLGYFPLEGICLWPEFITPEEEEAVVAEIDRRQWVDSQSGRRKQDYGPKVNFKKQKLNLQPFVGLPDFSELILTRIRTIPELEDFRCVELCNLEYTPQRSSHIEPHTDDAWLWGDRLITLNLLSDTYLTLTPCQQGDSASAGVQDLESPVFVHAFMPRRSLFVMKGESRYRWRHAVLPHDISARRLAMTFRELSAEFATGAQQELGARLFDIACSFQGNTNFFMQNKVA